MDPKLLDILACPLCKSAVRLNAEYTELWCKADGLAFPIRDDIPVMLETEARTISNDERLDLLMTQAFCVVIPARFASPRLPGKPLQDIAGMPLIQRVWLQAQKSAAQQVVIATDDQRIFSACESFGAQVVM